MSQSLKSELDVLRDVASRLEQAGFDYMLSGSLAMSFYATPRMTRDIDVVVALGAENAIRLREVFAQGYYVPDDLVRSIRSPGMFNLVHLESVVKVDIIVRKDDPYRRLEFERRRRIDLDGLPLWIVSREDLILSKLVWAKDAESELQRRDVINLLPDADVAYLHDWAPQLGVEELLERLAP